MNVLDFFVKLYAPLHNYPMVHKRVLTPFRVAVRYGARMVLPRYLAKTNSADPKSHAPIVVSFTSFPARIGNVWQVVECMRRQTCLPDKIILWLSKEQFPDSDSIPQSLRQRQGKWFEIRMVEGDIRSHKKYFYIAREEPDALVFLIDDDIYYDTRLIERVMEEHQMNLGAVICNYGRHVRRNDDGSLKPYIEWPFEFRYNESSDLFFGSGGGTLFKPSWLPAELTDIEKAREVCPIADDIWLNAMARLAGRKIVILENGEKLPVYNQDNVGLFQSNMLGGKNDEQLKAIMECYGRDLF